MHLLPGWPIVLGLQGESQEIFNVKYTLPVSCMVCHAWFMVHGLQGESQETKCSRYIYCTVCHGSGITRRVLGDLKCKTQLLYNCASITDRVSGAQSRQGARLSLQSSQLGPPPTSPAGECCPPTRVSFKTSFDSKQPKLEPKLVSALSETKPLFRLFRFYAETESFDVLIEPKTTEHQPKQFDREHILLFFTENFGFFRFFSDFFFFFGLFRNSLFSVVSLLYRNREFRLNRNKQKTHPNSLKESIFGNFSENLGLFRFVSVCYETDLFVSVVSIYVRNTETNRNFFFLVSRNKPKQT
jgi:hypothetical protein